MNNIDAIQAGHFAAGELAHRWAFVVNVEPVTAEQALEFAVGECPEEVMNDEVAFEAFKRHVIPEFSRLGLIK